MTKLLVSEIGKLKRNHIVQFTFITAFIFPTLLSILASHTGLPFTKLRMFIFIFGFYILLPIFISLILATLIFEERNNQTLKNILTIPVNREKVLFSKLILVVLIGLIYALVSLVIPVGIEIFTHSINFAKIIENIGLGLLPGFMVVLANSPILIIVLTVSKNYLMTFVVSLFYTIISFIFSLQYTSIPLPLSVVMKWSLPYISNGPQGVTQFFFSTPSCVGILSAITIISCYVAFKFFGREEV